MNPPAPPNSTRAMIPPTSDPARPRATVAYQGIGSGPGSAHRASPPTTKPHTISRRMKISTGPEAYATRYSRPDPRGPGREPIRLGRDRASPLSEEPADDGHEMTATMIPTMN